MFRKFHTAYFTCFTHVSHCFASVSQVSRTLFHTCFASANYVVTSPERFSVAHSRELNRTAACSCGGERVRAVTADSRDSHQIRECFASVSRVCALFHTGCFACFASVSQVFRKRFACFAQTVSHVSHTFRINFTLLHTTYTLRIRVTDSLHVDVPLLSLTKSS